LSGTDNHDFDDGYRAVDGEKIGGGSMDEHEYTRGQHTTIDRVDDQPVYDVVRIIEVRSVAGQEETESGRNQDVRQNGEDCKRQHGYELENAAMKLQISATMTAEIHINFFESRELCLDEAGEISVLALPGQGFAATHKNTTVSDDRSRSLRNGCKVEVR